LCQNLREAFRHYALEADSADQATGG
ncbi:MAG: hypothetical protein QG652_1620, partial [Pseudomonadota bacterium]|nr:hypothetical protein [Pseudomonadota bacterium]